MDRERERDWNTYEYYINLIHLSTFHLMSAPRLVILVGRASWSHAEMLKGCDWVMSKHESLHNDPLLLDETYWNHICPSSQWESLIFG